MVEFLKAWRRRRTLARHAVDPALWERVTSALEFLDGMPAEDLARLYALVVEFLAQKQMHGAAEFELSDEVRLSIAVQACLPILNLGLEHYAGWVGIVVYPGEFRVRREELDEDGVLHEWHDELSGEAWQGGPVVLSWEDVDTGEAGYNVVIHEFAHKLDMLSGDADGYPPAPAGVDAREWHTTLERAFDRFCDEVERADRATPAHRDTFEFDFDSYAAEHPAEFFAVMSEAFFTEPRHLRERYPELYAALGAFYRQDPAARLLR